jgi:hypothetical protein
MATVKRGKALVAQLRAQAGVRDPEALAAWLGRYKKARKAGLKPEQAKKVAKGTSKSRAPKLPPEPDVSDVPEFKGAGYIKQAEQWAAEHLTDPKRPFAKFNSRDVSLFDAEPKEAQFKPEKEWANKAIPHLAKRLRQFDRLPDRLKGIRVNPGSALASYNLDGMIYIGKEGSTAEGIEFSRKMNEATWHGPDAQKGYRDAVPNLVTGYLPEGTEYQDIIDHELGHAMFHGAESFEFGAFDQGTRDEWDDIFTRIRDAGDWHVSAYSLVDNGYGVGSEAFAECFSLYVNGRSDLLPPDVVKFMQREVS